MECDIIVKKVLGLFTAETVPTTNELQEMVGAKDHEEFHLIIQAMDSKEIEELHRKIIKWRKKKFGISTDYLEAAPIN